MRLITVVGSFVVVAIYDLPGVWLETFGETSYLK